MYRVYFYLIFIFLFLPFSVYCEPVAKCYSSDIFLLKTSYDTSNSIKYGINHQLFISYKQNNKKYSLDGEVILNDKGQLEGVLYKNNDMSFFIDKKGKKVLINETQSKKITEDDCFSFFASYDSTVNKNGDIISIFSYGKEFKTTKFQGQFKPSFNCSKTEFPIEKAICNNNEISYIDRLFYSMKECYKSKAKIFADKQTIYMIDEIVNDFMSYRNNIYRSNKEIFTESEEIDIKKAYSLGIIFLPMTIAANNSNLRVLGRDLFLSYYMLSIQGIKYSSNYEKGLNQSDIVKDVFGQHYDEIMFYYASVYDNINNRLSSLLYWTVYLLEQYKIVDTNGNIICR